MDSNNPRIHRWIYASVNNGLQLLTETEITITCHREHDHAHNFFQVLVILEGGMLLHSKYGTTKLEVNDVIVIPPKYGHHINKSDTGLRCVYLDLRLRVLSHSLITDTLNNLPVIRKLSATSNDVGIIQSHFNNAVNNKEPARFAGMMAGIWLLFETIENSTTDSTANKKNIISSDSRILLVDSYIRERMDKTLDVPTLAGVARLSTSQLTRLYREQMDTTPSQRITQLRIDRAYELLMGGTLSNKEIGAACGFKDSSQFSKSFKKVTGYSPKEARKREISV